jgi:hypothetical protein
MDIPADRQQWFEHLCRHAGSHGQVQGYRDESGEHSIEVFRADGGSGALLATIGLMDIDQAPKPGAGAGASIFCEIIVESLGKDERLDNMLATVAFHAMKHEWRIAPGVVFGGMLDMYFPEHPLAHVMFVAPFQWETGMTQVKLASKTIYPLVAVPISEAERAYAAEHSPRGLEQVWQSQRVNVFDWNRPSAV